MLALTACGAAAASGYTPPAITAAADGWQGYVDAPLVDGADVAGLDPAPDSPEAAVVKFLASRARGDTAWQGAVVADPSERMQRVLGVWDDWQLRRFQLRGRQDQGSDGVRIRVFFEIGTDGDTDAGEDEFEVIREGSEWRISRAPA